MFGLIKKYKDKKYAEWLEAENILKADYEAERKENLDILQNAEEIMANQPCAINQNSNCNNACVHYGAGWIKYRRFGYCEGKHPKYNGYWNLNYPYCKLWHKE